ncbi:MAG: hypothetical protein L0H53_04495 [Candidatus Nitrosocosmicus sp.]|nr:hypothetical protein [Candidatus Nitrosocosmicus sp.]MDN5866229.1 hypothetical protein [Candidatus Nitrosocosmicus sp.]
MSTNNKNHTAKREAIIISVIVAIVATLITVWALWSTTGVNEPLPPTPAPQPDDPIPPPPVDNDTDTNTNDTNDNTNDTSDTDGPLTFEEICNIEPKAEVCIAPLNITILQQNESL